MSNIRAGLVSLSTRQRSNLDMAHANLLHCSVPVVALFHCTISILSFLSLLDFGNTSYLKPRGVEQITERLFFEAFDTTCRYWSGNIYNFILEKMFVLFYICKEHSLSKKYIILPETLRLGSIASVTGLK